MSAQPVDVLGVMLEAERELMLAKQAASKSRGDRRHGYEQSERSIRAARSAVAELIEAVEAYREADDEVATSGYGRGECHLHAKAAAATRVDAALARVGGAP